VESRDTCSAFHDSSTGEVGRISSSWHRRDRSARRSMLLRWI